MKSKIQKQSMINYLLLCAVFVLLITSGFTQDTGIAPGYSAIDRARGVVGNKIKCPQCGALNDPNNANCVSCGFPLKPSGTPATPTVAPVPPQSTPADEYRQRFDRAAPSVALEGGTPGAPALPKEEKKYTAYEGVHEWCVKCGKELRKPKRIEILESQLSGYYDDGPQGGHGDAVAGDGIYSNVTEERDRLCDEDYYQLQAIQRLLIHAEKDSPVEFYMVTAATEDPVSNPPSPIPTYGYWTTQRTEFLSDYTLRVLAPFKDPISGIFYQHFQFTAEELAAMAAEKKRILQTAKMQSGQQIPGGPTGPNWEAQPGMQSSYFGERHPGGPEGPIGP